MRSQIEEFTFRAFEEPVSPEDVRAFQQSIGQEQSRTRSRSATIGISVVLLITIILGYSSQTGSGASGFLIVIGFVLALYYVAARWRVKRRARLYKFAVQNAIQYQANVSAAGREGMIFGFGSDRRVEDLFTLPNGIEIANYHYTTGSGKSRQEHVWGFVCIPLERRLPHMVLDSRKNNLFGKLSNLPQSFRGAQKLSLEGDFDRYFTLYAPLAYETDALYVFTPDVMQALITAGDGFDMEVIDNRLYIYRTAGYRFEKSETWRQLHGIIESIGAEISHQTRRYADTRIADRSMDTVDEAGRRLEGGVGWLGVSILVLFGLLFLLQVAFQFGIIRSISQ